MSKKSISYDKRIKKIIEENHDGNFYETSELTNVCNNILVEVKKDYDTDHATLADSITYFVYYSDKTDKYFLNHKRRQSKKKDYHNTLLNNLTGATINIPEQVGVFEVNEKNEKGKEEMVLSVSEEKNENIEPTSEELMLLEKEIFNKKEKEKEINVINENNEKDEVNNDDNDDDIENMKYIHPVDKPFQPNKKYYFEPYGTQWVHDVQVDDVITEREIKLGKQFDILRAIVLPEQGTVGWHKMRDGKITASDGGTVLDVNHHEQQYKFILKKTIGLPFVSNEYVHHGKKLEDIAILIYEYRMNVKCEAFGLIGHPKYDFLGASPDSICGKFKLDGVHKSKFIGRMLEIKCPLIRKIKTEGPIIDHICPIYYWVQVQLQLECCDLEECDFWQCEIREYESRDDFIEDTHPNEPFRSKEYGFEKGCLIQLLPRDKMKDILDGDYNTVLWDKSKFIYPPKIEMTPYDCDIWISQVLGELSNNDDYKDYFFDKVIYWKLVKSKCVLINRDRKWFADNLPNFERMWNYVLFYRKNKEKMDLLAKYIEALPVKKNKLIMKVVEKIYNTSDPDYKNIIKDINDDIKSIINKKNEVVIDDDDGYMFVNPKGEEEIEDEEPKAKPTISKSKVAIKKEIKNNDDDYMFVDSKPKTVIKNKPNIIMKKVEKKVEIEEDDDYLFVNPSKKVTSTNTIINKPKKIIGNPAIIQDDDDYPFV